MSTLEPGFPRRYSRWPTRLLNAAFSLILLGLLAGVMLVTVSLFLPGAAGDDPQAFFSALKSALRWTGVGLLAVSGALFVAFPWVGVYVQVMEGSRGLPVPETIGDPTVNPAVGVPADAVKALQGGPDGLAGIGFEPAGWFSLDTFGHLHIGAWRHISHPAFAFILFEPGGQPRLRIVRRFRNGVILTTSNRLVDVGVAPPASMYTQMRKTASAAELWSWHLEAEALFAEETAAPRRGDRRITRSPGDFADGPAGAPSRQAPDPAAGRDAMEVYTEIRIRWVWLHRARRWWLLRLNPFRECWRMYCLPGVSLRQQIDEGWAVSPRLRQQVCLLVEDRIDLARILDEIGEEFGLVIPEDRRDPGSTFESVVRDLAGRICRHPAART